MSTLRTGLKNVLRSAADQEKSFEGAELDNLKDVLAVAAAGRRAAARQLAKMPAEPWPGRPEPHVGEVTDGLAASDEAAAGRLELSRALDGVADMALQESVEAHATGMPGYVWRDILDVAIREPLHDYAGRLIEAGDTERGVAVAKSFYEAVVDAGLPEPAISDASYDLARSLAMAGRPDESLRVLPSVFDHDEPEAQRVRRSLAMSDPELASVRNDPRFRDVVGAE